MFLSNPPDLAPLQAQLAAETLARASAFAAELAARMSADTTHASRITTLESMAAVNGGAQTTRLTHQAGAAAIATIGSDGTTLTILTTAAHGLADGDYIAVAGTVAYNGRYGPIDVISADEIHVPTVIPASPSEMVGTIATSALRVEDSDEFLPGMYLEVVNEDGEIHVSVVSTAAAGLIQLVTPIPITWVAGARALVNAQVSITTREVALARAIIAGSDSMTLPTLLSALKGRRLPLRAFGLVDGGAIDVALTRAMVVALPGTLFECEPGEYTWLQDVGWTVDDCKIDGANSVVDVTGTEGIITVHADRGHVENFRFRHYPAAGEQTSGYLFRIKNSASEDVGDHTGWVVKNVSGINFSVRATAIDRLSVRIPLIMTTLREPMLAGDLVLKVNTIPATYVDTMRARVLLDNFVVETREISSIDYVAKTITVASGFSSGAPTHRRVTAYTVTTSPMLAGDDTVDVELGDTTNLFPVNSWVYLVLDTGATHVSQIGARGANSVTLVTPVPSAVSVGNGITGLNNGQAPNGTDLQGCLLEDLFLEFCRANYCVEIGGGLRTRCIRVRVEDCRRFIDPDDARNFLKVDPADVAEEDLDNYFGEAFKGTAATQDLLLEDCVAIRCGRNGFDGYNSARADLVRCHFSKGFSALASGVELKRSSTDITPPDIVRIIDCVIADFKGYGLYIAVPNVQIRGGRIERVGKTALYVDGMRGAIGAADSEEELSSLGYTSYLQVDGLRIIDPEESGVLLTEVSNSSFTNMLVTGWKAYGFFFSEKPIKCKLSNSSFFAPRSGTDYIRIVGTAGVDTLHDISGIEVDNFVDAYSIGTNVTYVSYEGRGSESGLLAGQTPTASKWRDGRLVQNATDNKWYLRVNTGWSPAFV